MISLNDFDAQFEDVHIGGTSIYFHSIHADQARRLAEIVTKHLDRPHDQPVLVREAVKLSDDKRTVLIDTDVYKGGKVYLETKSVWQQVRLCKLLSYNRPPEDACVY